MEWNTLRKFQGMESQEKAETISFHNILFIRDMADYFELGLRLV